MARWGPFRARPYFLVKNAGYDDNVFFDAEQAQGDWTATLSPGLRLLLLTGRRGGIVLQEEADYVAFSRFSDLDYWNSVTRARWIGLTRRAVPSVQARYAWIRDRPTSEIDQRLRRAETGLTFAARTRGEGRLGGRGEATLARFDYEEEPGTEEIAKDLDRTERRISMTGELRILPKTTLLLEARLERYRFTDEAAGRDARGRALLPGVRFDPSARVEGELRVGPARLDADDEGTSDFHGVAFEARLLARLGSASRVGAGGERGPVFSTAGDNLYFVGEQAWISWEQFLSRRVSGEIVHRRGRNEYPLPVPGPSGVPIPREDDLLAWEGILRLRTGDTVLAVSAQWLVRDSTDDRSDLRRGLYAVGTTVRF